MNIKDILSDKEQEIAYIFNQEYYGSIYKKTEKIVCAVFLITDNSKDSEKTKDVVKDIRSVAKDAFMSVATMMSGKGVEEDTFSASIRNLIALRGLLHVLVASRGVRSDLVDVLTREIDGVIEGVYGMVTRRHEDGLGDALEYEPRYVAGSVREDRGRKQKGALLAPFQRRTDTKAAVPGQSTGGSRRESILAIIRARGVVSIKDISDSITDCSEKTIQRELIGLVKDNIIVREGERRWSKYKLV